MKARGDRAMTREEIIKWLKSLKAEIGKSEHRTLWHYAEAIDMAIEAIQNEDREDYELATEQMEHAHSLRTS